MIQKPPHGRTLPFDSAMRPSLNRLQSAPVSRIVRVEGMLSTYCAWMTTDSSRTANPPISKFTAIGWLSLILFPSSNGTTRYSGKGPTHQSTPTDLSKSTSEWTLDYPPAFAYFEWLLSQVAHYVDPQLLDLDNLGYDSWQTIYFQRATVVLAESLLIYALHRLDCTIPMACMPLTAVASFNQRPSPPGKLPTPQPYRSCCHRLC